MRPSRSRSPLIILLLALTMLLTAFLAWEAQDAVRSYKRTAQRVIGDYAELAASEYVHRIRPELEYYAYQPALKMISDHRRQTHSPADVPVPSPIVVFIDEDSTLSIDLVRYYFHLTFDGKEIVTRGDPPEPETPLWLADTLVIDARTRYKTEWPSATLIGTAGGSAHQIVYQVDRDAAGAAIGASGFEAKSSGMDVYFAYSYDMLPLIPAALTRGVAQDSLVALTITAPNAAVLYRSPKQYQSPLTAEANIGLRFGGMIARATLHPAFAEAIVIEGPPRRQLPLLIGIFVATMGLMTAALVQLRREAELARLRSDFVSSVSHELKTPLAQIRLFAETLLLGRVRSENEAQRSLAIIDQEAKRLTHLV